MSIEDGGPAFPINRDMWMPGMSLRDWFAGQAMDSAAAAVHLNFMASERIAEAAYSLADAMLAQRRKGAP